MENLGRNTNVGVALNGINQVLGLIENRDLTREEKDLKIVAVLRTLYQDGQTAGYSKGRREVKRFLGNMEETLETMRNS